MRRLLAALAGLLLLTSLALAYQPDEVLPDPAKEARARAITRELRCLVCQNESIDASNAPLARDLRVLVRERIMAGDSDEEVLAYVVDRYGEFVLLRPPVRPETYALWFGPFAVLALGLGLVALFVRGRGAAPEGASDRPLSAEEMRRLASMLKDETKA